METIAIALGALGMLMVLIARSAGANWERRRRRPWVSAGEVTLWHALCGSLMVALAVSPAFNDGSFSDPVLQALALVSLGLYVRLLASPSWFRPGGRFERLSRSGG